MIVSDIANENAYSDKFPITSAGKHRYRETEEGLIIMCEIMERINEETRVETREETLKEVNELNIRLINENRLDDLRRAATDIAYQSQLLQELFPQRAH